MIEAQDGEKLQLTVFPILTISPLTAMGEAVNIISIPDAGGSQPFIRESSGAIPRRRYMKNRALNKAMVIILFIDVPV